MSALSDVVAEMRESFIYEPQLNAYISAWADRIEAYEAATLEPVAKFVVVDGRFSVSIDNYQIAKILELGGCDVFPAAPEPPVAPRSGVALDADVGPTHEEGE